MFRMKSHTAEQENESGDKTRAKISSKLSGPSAMLYVDEVDMLNSHNSNRFEEDKRSHQTPQEEEINQV